MNPFSLLRFPSPVIGLSASALRLLQAVVLLTAFHGTSLSAQTGRPDVGGDSVKGAEANVLLSKVRAEQKRLIEDRRQALLQAEQAKTADDKLRVLQALQTDHRERKQALLEDRAKIREAEKQDRAAKKRNSTPGS